MIKKNVWTVIIIVIILAGAFFLSKTPAKPQAKSDQAKLQAAASFYPLYFFTSEIGKDKVNVLNITPADAEPHDYEPTAEEAAQIENSRILILNGGNLEPWGDKIKQNIDPQKTLVMTAGEGLTTQQVVEDGEKITDPHIWLSPPLAEQMVDKIAVGLSEVDPTNAEYYKTNAEDLKTRLASLDQEYKSGLSMCADKNIITSHAAFGYLATELGLYQVPIAGLSPDAEPSPQQLADIAKFAKDHKVKYIFFESLVSPKLSETIASEVEAKTMVLNPIEGLTADQVSAGDDYFKEMESNLANLKIALSCQ